MTAEWIKSPNARRVLVHWADARPAWLWSQDGETLLWRNDAARYFHGKIKKHGLRLWPDAVPIKGQIARLVRLGSPGRSSLSRIQFLAGERPVSTTCSCTPLELANGELGLLIVGVDAIEPELLEAGQPAGTDPAAERLFPKGSDYLVVSDDSQVIGGSPLALERYAPGIESEGLPPLPDSDSGPAEIGGDVMTLTRYRASQHDALLLLFERAGVAETAIEAARDDEGIDTAEESFDEPLLPLGLPPADAVPVRPPAGVNWIEVEADGDEQRSLASLFDRLADDDELYTPLTQADEQFDGPAAIEREADVIGTLIEYADDTDEFGVDEAGAVSAEMEAEAPRDDIEPALAEAQTTGSAVEPTAAEAALQPAAEGSSAAVPEFVAEAVEAERDKATGQTYAENEEPGAVTWRVIGRGFVPIAVEAPADVAASEPAALAQTETEIVPAQSREGPSPREITATTTTATAVIIEAEPEIELPELADEAAGEPAYDASEEAGAESSAAPPAAEMVSAAAPEATAPPPLPVPPEALDAPALVIAEDEPTPAPEPPADREAVERVSRYNFDELSRILAERVGGPPAAEIGRTEPAPEGALINLSGETFLLNRLPLGILVFRDQQVLFANRALTDLTGHDSIESLRVAGLTSIFPAEDSAASGPVTHLVRRDGAPLGVNARLQSITWQGRPALMLSASLAESRLGHEAAVKTFAELAAASRDEGFLTADRSGVVTLVSLHGRIVLGLTEAELINRPLSSLIDAAEVGELKRFLERPARFAETARPGIKLRGLVPNTELVLFAEGQAGIVTGYFGFARKLPVAPSGKAERTDDEVEPAMLARISRGIRRPLNTIVGFAELIRSAAFGPVENPRYVEYARDIGTAGHEITTLVDEVDDYARLRDGRYPARPDQIDLALLLETAAQRVRRQAALERVLIRSAISERLPRITADRGSLIQAILNLLASAIDQTPAGGTVILSAQLDDEGGVLINVRDNATSRGDIGERFVVFRDGVGRDGELLLPVRSSVGLALTRSLLAVNALTLSMDPAAGTGTLFSLVIPAALVAEAG